MDKIDAYTRLLNLQPVFISYFYYTLGNEAWSAVEASKWEPWGVFTRYVCESRPLAAHGGEDCRIVQDRGNISNEQS